MTRVAKNDHCKAPWAAFGAVLLFANTGCGKIDEHASVPLKPAVEIGQKASLSGRVTLQGVDPAQLTKTVDVGGNPFCTDHGQISDPNWKVATDGALANVVIFVAGSSRASNLPPVDPLIDQTHCEFVPHTLAVQAGQKVRFHNSDLTFHNIRIVQHEIGTSAGGANLDNLAQASRGDENVRAFDVPGIYRLECDVHRWMKAWVFVHEGVHAAVSAADGRYVVSRALPDGDYTVQAWHPQFAKPLSRQVTVVNGTGTADFTFDFAQAFKL